MSCDFRIMDRRNARSRLTWHALIWQYCIVKSYGRVDRRSRLLENAAKEMHYTAFRDKPEKEAVFLGNLDVCSAMVLRLNEVLC